MAEPALRIKRREIDAAVHLPFTRHVTPEVIGSSNRTLVTCIRCEGVSFETADPVDLNDLHTKLNLTLRNIADERLALWTHVIRTRNASYPAEASGRHLRAISIEPTGSVAASGPVSERPGPEPCLAPRPRSG